MTTFTETNCKSFINRLNESLFTIRTYSIRLSGNPYGGCQFHCAYCYAPYVYRFNAGATPEEFGSKVFVRVNAPEVLERELERGLSRGRLRREYLDLGTVTDAYQPAEERYCITRRCLEVFLRYEFPVTVLTKSALVLRDIDLWKALAARGLGAIGFTLTRPTTVPARYKNLLEPYSPGAGKLLEAMRVAVEAGVPTFAFVNPVVPFLTAESELVQQLLAEIAATGNRKVFFGVMKLSALTWSLFRRRLEARSPEMVPLFHDLYLRRGVKEFGRSWVPPYEYREELYRLARDTCRELGIGFSCEGNLFHLWLDDWAEVEDPYRYPSGYNIWQAVRARRGEPVHLADVQERLATRFPVLNDGYFSALETLWKSDRLFEEVKDIAFWRDDGHCGYLYRSELPSPAEEQLLPVAA
jgi:DNA repair photolyase